jgi:hypothetical protein
MYLSLKDSHTIWRYLVTLLDPSYFARNQEQLVTYDAYLTRVRDFEKLARCFQVIFAQVQDLEKYREGFHIGKLVFHFAPYLKQYLSLSASFDKHVAPPTDLPVNLQDFYNIVNG